MEADATELEGTSDQVRLAESIAQLGLEHRWPLVLREYAGFSYGDIAWVVGVPIGTVKARLARARIKLLKLQQGGAA